MLLFCNICKCSHSELHIVFRNTDGKENYKNQRRIKFQISITIPNNLIGKCTIVHYKTIWIKRMWNLLCRGLCTQFKLLWSKFENDLKLHCIKNIPYTSIFFSSSLDDRRSTKSKQSSTKRRVSKNKSVMKYATIVTFFIFFGYIAHWHEWIQGLLWK